MADKPHYNVLIATPGLNFANAYVRSLIETTAFLSSKNISWKFLNHYSSLVAVAREMTLNDSQPDSQYVGNGQYTYDKIFWIDSDIQWEVEDFLKILSHDKDVISGVYPVVFKNKAAILKEKTFNFDLMSPAHFESNLTEPERIWACGMGFMCMRSGIVESIEKPWFWHPYIEMNDADGNIINRRNPSEDIAFCEKINQAGFEIWMDPTVKLKHFKDIGFEIGMA
jgi:hypothetical protein